MTGTAPCHPGEPVGWHGIFLPLRHYVPDWASRMHIRGDLLAFAFPCKSVCTPPTERTAELDWCPECRAYIDWMWQ